MQIWIVYCSYGVHVDIDIANPEPYRSNIDIRTTCAWYPCSSLDFNQIHDYQCECAHTILISGYPVVQVRSTVLNVECGVMESGMRFARHMSTPRRGASPKSGVTSPQHTQRGSGAHQAARPISTCAKRKVLLHPLGSRRGRHRAPRERRRPPRSARTGAAATQFGPPARRCKNDVTFSGGTRASGLATD